MDLSAWIEALFPKEFLQKVYRLLPDLSFERRMRWDLFKRPDYAYGVYRAALTAQALDIKRISAIEFGVAAGNGLLGLEEAAGEVAQSDHPAGPRDAVDVDVEDRQEDADAKRSAAGEVGVGDFLDVRHRAVGWAEQRVGVGRYVPMRIAKEGDDEQPAR